MVASGLPSARRIMLISIPMKRLFRRAVNDVAGQRNIRPLPHKMTNNLRAAGPLRADIALGITLGITYLT